MPALTNPRHEAFCRAYVRGRTAGNAAASYASVFGGKASDKNLRKSASRLSHRADISQRCAELVAAVARIEEEATEKAAAEAGITKARILNELAKLGFSNMFDYIRVNANGDATVDLSALDRDKASAIQYVEVETYVDGRGDDANIVKRIKFRLADKHAPLVSMGKHFAMFVDVVKNPEGEQKPMKAVDLPPPETMEQWVARRQKELAAVAVVTKEEASAAAKAKRESPRRK
jgi:phage terminase small subunit